MTENEEDADMNEEQIKGHWVQVRLGDLYIVSHFQGKKESDIPWAKKMPFCRDNVSYIYEVATVQGEANQGWSEVFQNWKL